MFLLPVKFLVRDFAGSPIVEHKISRHVLPCLLFSFSSLNAYTQVPAAGEK